MTSNIQLLDKKGYANLKAVMDPNIDLYLILGMRGDGKTFSAVSLALDAMFPTRQGVTAKPSAYVRRLDASLTKAECNRLLQPHVKGAGRSHPSIEKRSKGQYNNYTYRAGEFKPVYTDWETGSTERTGEPMLYTMALNTWETSKGADRGDLAYIIFDEFITSKSYFKDEVFAWENVISTLQRGRDVKIIMLANALNTFCPYFDYYGIDWEKYKPGDVADFKYKTGLKARFVHLPAKDPNSTKPQRKNRFFGLQNNSMSITSGEWEIRTYRLLSQTNYEKSLRLYRCGIIFHGKRFICEVLMYAGESTDIFAYFYPAKNFRDCLVIFSDDDKMEPGSIYETCFGDGILSRDLLDLFTQGKMYYNTNKTGNYIQAWIENFVNKRRVIKP